MAKDRRRSVEGGVGCGVGGKTMIICLANYAQFLVIVQSYEIFFERRMLEGAG
jgi:hypothetical protein